MLQGNISAYRATSYNTIYSKNAKKSPNGTLAYNIITGIHSYGMMYPQIDSYVYVFDDAKEILLNFYDGVLPSRIQELYNRVNDDPDIQQCIMNYVIPIIISSPLAACGYTGVIYNQTFMDIIRHRKFLERKENEKKTENNESRAKTNR